MIESVKKMRQQGKSVLVDVHTAALALELL
jgi:hypothetical protein